MVVFPLFYDQFMFARRLASLGVAAKSWVPLRQLTEEALAFAIHQVDTPAAHDAARALGQKLLEEDGANAPALVL
jgi:UDP:flavonoid glycosyltransferase YjiC (YdhE family)